MKTSCHFLEVVMLAVATTVVSAQGSPVAFDGFEYSGTNAVNTKLGAGEYQNTILAGIYPDPMSFPTGEIPAAWRDACSMPASPLRLRSKSPANRGVSAGIAVFQGENFHYFAGVRRETNGLGIFLERSKGRGSQETVKRVNVAAAKTVRLRVTANDATCTFEFAKEAAGWETLATDQDATLLTTDVAGGFVGATVGPYARIDGSGNP